MALGAVEVGEGVRVQRQPLPRNSKISAHPSKTEDQYGRRIDADE